MCHIVHVGREISGHADRGSDEQVFGFSVILVRHAQCIHGYISQVLSVANLKTMIGQVYH
jgi:hypothetical protein